MAIDVPLAFRPIAIVEDRYGGTYSDGCWLAIRNADQPIDGNPRVCWILDDGPHGDDVTAREFWSAAPDWIAVGSSPDEALQNLIATER